MVVSFPEKKKAKKFIEEGGESPKKREKEEVVFSLRLPIKVAEKIDKTLESGIKKFERINTSSLFQKLLFVLVNMSEGTFLLNKDLYSVLGSIRSLLMISN